MHILSYLSKKRYNFLKFILAKPLADKVLGEDYCIVETFKGKDLVGTKYEQLMPFVKVEGKAFEVVADNYVTGVTKNEISAHTGISARNLNRYLGYEEFAGIYIPETDFGTGVEGKRAEGKVSL